MNKLLTEYYLAREAHDNALSAFDSETARIIGVITRFFKVSNFWWAYEYYEGENSPLPLPRKIRDGYMEIFIDKECDSGRHQYNESIPTKFYDMKEDEIISYLKFEVEEYKAEQSSLKEAQKLKKEEKEKKLKQIKEFALSKLTKEEKKALKL